MNELSRALAQEGIDDMQVGVVLKSAKHALSCIEKWMAPKKVHLLLCL